MLSIDILFARFHKPLPTDQWESLLNSLPIAIQDEILKYKQWGDRTARLLGKLLLKERAPQALDALEYNRYKRPVTGLDMDFNISHSGEMVVCALGDHLRLGVDIEKIRPIKPDKFKAYMRPEELHAIQSSPNPDQSFFKYWTRKESIMKADGRGFYAPLDQVFLRGDFGELEDQIWRLHEIHIDPSYCCTLAHDGDEVELNCEEVVF